MPSISPAYLDLPATIENVAQYELWAKLKQTAIRQAAARRRAPGNDNIAKAVWATTGSNTSPPQVESTREIYAAHPWRERFKREQSAIPHVTSAALLVGDVA
jgi:hypothetical protein